MIRLFEQHHIRKQKELDGIWKFIKEDEKEYDLPVPGCWEQHPDLLTYRGKGTFYKRIYLSEKCNVRLEFKGVSHTADVYFDDVFVAHHYNAFTGFEGIVKDVAAGEHVISVHVDNTFGPHSALHTPNDYYTYGGITRPVVLEVLQSVYVKQVHFLPCKQENEWVGHTDITVVNLSEEEQKVVVTANLDDKNFIEKMVLLPKESKCIQWQQKFAKAQTWDMENPKLYLLDVKIQTENGVYVDDYVDRVGFREVKLKGNRLLLNGKPVFLKGFNRHEDYAGLGCAIPFQIMAHDMDLMQEVGSNAVRTCHYPNDERFLDLCDERGMLVWEENHARGFGLERMQNPNFEKQCEDCIEEMINQHYNHPAIVIWGILNECASETEEGRIMYKKQYDQIKEMDTSRPTTSATCRFFNDICLDLPDIVSFNYYSGWYQSSVDTVKERFDKVMDWINASGGEGKPVIVSEFGGAAIYGYRDRGRCKWSEERQGDIIRDNLEVYGHDERLTGLFIWQFADCKVTEQEWYGSRARCHNNKGVMDEYRRPKEAFDVVKELFPTIKG